MIGSKWSVSEVDRLIITVKARQTRAMMNDMRCEEWCRICMIKCEWCKRNVSDKNFLLVLNCTFVNSIKGMSVVQINCLQVMNWCTTKLAWIRIEILLGNIIEKDNICGWK